MFLLPNPLLNQNIICIPSIGSEKKKYSFLKTQSYSIILHKYNIFDLFDQHNLYVYSRSSHYRYKIFLSYNVITYPILNKIKDGFLFFYFKHNTKIVNSLNFFLASKKSYSIKMIHLLNVSMLNGLIGYMLKLDVIGYIRRAWYKKKKKALYFRLGKSYFNKIILPKKILLILTKKRFLFFFSTFYSILQLNVSIIRSLKRTSLYKLTGIIYHDEVVTLKKSKKHKAGASY